MDDQRFAHVGRDPKFRSMPKKYRKVKIDKRFDAMFKVRIGWGVKIQPQSLWLKWEVHVKASENSAKFITKSGIQKIWYSIKSISN